jgi:hypothetical protein
MRIEDIEGHWNAKRWKKWVFVCSHSRHLSKEVES